jgi:hypothetical protein
MLTPHILFSWVGYLEPHAAEKGTIPAQSHQISGTSKNKVFKLLSSPSGSLMCFGLHQRHTRTPYRMICEILKPYINDYALTNNILQEACENAKVDLFGDPEDKVKYTYAIQRQLRRWVTQLSSSSWINMQQ